MKKEEIVKVSTGGIGLGSLLFLLFLGLKLGGVGAVATWSWWWVTAPLWGPIVVVLGILLLLVIVAGIITAFTK